MQEVVRLRLLGLESAGSGKESVREEIKWPEDGGKSSRNMENCRLQYENVKNEGHSEIQRKCYEKTG